MKPEDMDSESPYCRVVYDSADKPLMVWWDHSERDEAGELRPSEPPRQPNEAARARAERSDVPVDANGVPDFESDGFPGRAELPEVSMPDGELPTPDKFA